MKKKSIYQELYNIVSPKLNLYRTDLEKHDKETLEKYSGPFLYGYRPTGTSILKMGLNIKEWFPDMTYRPVFGDKTILKDYDEACDVLKAELLWIIPGADNKWFLYFDGKTLKEVTKEEVEKYWKWYIFNLRMAAPMRFDNAKAIFV